MSSADDAMLTLAEILAVAYRQGNFAAAEHIEALSRAEVDAALVVATAISTERIKGVSRK